MGKTAEPSNLIGVTGAAFSDDLRFSSSCRVLPRFSVSGTGYSDPPTILSHFFRQHHAPPFVFRSSAARRAALKICS